MFRPLYLEPLEDRSLPSVLVVGDARGVSVDPEPLEDHTLASTAYAPLPDGSSTHSSRVADIFYAVEMGADIHVNEPLDEGVVAYWRLQINTFCSVASSLESEARGNTVENGLPMTPSSSPRETMGAVILDRSTTSAEPSGKPSLSAVASLDTLAFLGDSTLTNGTEEMLASGPLADALLLNGWQYELPAPQADLVPASDKDLTTIAAYLVGSPSAPPAAPPPANVTPASGADSGPTDFIVGFQPQRSAPIPGRPADDRTDTSPPPPARDSAPAAPEGISPAPPACAPAPATADTGVVPPDAKNGSPGAQKDADDVPPSAPAPAEMQEEAGDGE